LTSNEAALVDLALEDKESGKSGESDDDKESERERLIPILDV